MPRSVCCWDFLTTFGGKPYAQINSTYTEASGQPAASAFIYGGDVIDSSYSRGVDLTQSAYFDFAVRLNERPGLLDQDAELAPFMPDRENFAWMINIKTAERKYWVDSAQRAREVAVKLSRAGVKIGTGTDIWQIPTGVHMELEQLVAAGLTPLEAIHAGTGAAARILGVGNELGTIQVGKWADIILLDADPLPDVRNTRRIWKVLHYGHLVDRSAIRKTIKPR